MTGKTAVACGAFAALLLASCGRSWDDFTFSGSDAGGVGGADSSVPPTGCGPLQKPCNGACVERPDPAYGCSDNDCGPACRPSNAVPACKNRSCAVDHCESGWGDCNASALDGCETPLTTSSDCSACGRGCVLAHAVADCLTGQCRVTACESGWGNCNNDPADGCEVSLKTLQNCGGCGVICDRSPQSSTCVTGVCEVDICPGGTADCDGNGTCETDLNSVDSCGACGSVCQLPNANPACQAGQCVVAGCMNPYGNCNANPADGCETNLNTNVDNCGVCGAACSKVNSTSVCNAGTCELSCIGTYQDCDHDPLNGCESDIMSDDANCGGCGHACSLPQATSQCISGNCRVGQCTTGWGDCDSNPSNGCEADFSSDLHNCGGCGILCPAYPNAVPTCSNGQCGTTCTTGFLDCDGNPADGCEADTSSSVANCGACHRACSASHVQTLRCTGGLCNSTCASGHSNCTFPASPQPDDGCETLAACP